MLVPFYKNKFNKYVSTNWATLLDIYVKYSYLCTSILKKKVNFVGGTGNLVDSKTALSLKRFLQYEGSSVIESRAYQNQEHLLDFFEMFSVNAESFKQSSILFLVGINLRLEAPFYNLKIKKNKNLTIFVCGVGDAYYTQKYVNTNVQILNLGSTLKSLVKLLEGRSILSNYVEQLIKSTAGNILFLIGSSASQRKDIVNLVNMCNFYKLFQQTTKKVFVNVLQPHIGRITANSLNLRPGRSVLQNNNSLFLKNNIFLFKKNIYFFYNQGLDDFRNLNNYKYSYNIFHIFMGHTVLSTIATAVDLLLPTCTFLEKETLYFNVEGVLRESKIVLAPYLNLNVLSDWQTYFLFFKKKKIFANQITAAFPKIQIAFQFHKVSTLLNKFNARHNLQKDIFFLTWFSRRGVKKTKYVTSFKKINKLLFTNFIKLITTLYFQKFVYLFVFAKSLFKTIAIDFFLSKQLITYSRLFCINNQYSNKNVVSPSLTPIFVTIKLYLINFPLIQKYRSYFADNIISKNTLDILKIKNNLNSLASNYIYIK